MKEEIKNLKILDLKLSKILVYLLNNVIVLFEVSKKKCFYQNVQCVIVKN